VSIFVEDRLDFFVSYTGIDRGWAEWIGWVLEEEGYRVVLQHWDFHPGTNFVDLMDQAVQQSSHTIAVLSPEYQNSRFGKDEWTAAFTQHTLIPVLVRETEIRGILAPISYVDLVGEDEAGAREQLLAGVRKERAKPEQAPAFPGRAAAPPPRFPGALPDIWNVPPYRNLNFTGRDKLLSDLQDMLSAGTPVAIWGLGGVGKTQLAVEYAHRHTGDYTTVWWVSAEESATLAAGYAGLAHRLGLGAEIEQDVGAAVDAVRDRLGRESGWMLVFDNATGPAEVKRCIPAGGNGHVIVTSRTPNWAGTAKALGVDVLSEEDAVTFLLTRTQDDDEATARALAADLGYLPLALEQAGGYITSSGRSLAEYRQLLAGQRAQLLAQRSEESDYPETVATTWKVSLDAASAEEPAAGDLLRLVAFLAPEDLPRELLVEQAEHLRDPLAESVRDPLKFDRMLAALRRYSLITTAGSAFSVHRLVQAVTADSLSPAQRETWAGQATAVLANGFAFDADDLSSWAACQRLLPHALAAVGHSGAYAVGVETTVGLMLGAAAYLRTRAELYQARELLETTVAITAQMCGPGDPMLALANNDLGLVLQMLGDYPTAREALQRALVINEQVYGQGHPAVAVNVSNLAMVLRDLGDYPAAHDACQLALAINEDVYGRSHPAVAKNLNILGGALQDLGDYDAARDAYQSALTINEQAFGPDHRAVATDVNNLGIVLRALGDYRAARDAFQRALTIDEQVYGQVHPAVATDLSNLGMILRGFGDYPGARDAVQRALNIDEQVYGQVHPDVATDVNNLGSVLQDLGDYPAAREALERALSIRLATLGDSHPSAAATARRLAQVHADLGDVDSARTLAEQAIAIDGRAYGRDRPEVASDLEILAAILDQAGDAVEAQATRARAAAIRAEAE